MISARPMYGIGYVPIGNLVNVLDPFGLRKVPGAIKGGSITPSRRARSTPPTSPAPRSKRASVAP